MKKKKLLRPAAVLAVISMTLSSLAYTPSTAAAKEKPVQAAQIEDVKSQPIYSYEEAIRETVYVESTLDSDENGKADRIAVDIIRPKETEEGLKVPVIMDASPYYESLGRGNESEVKDRDKDGVNEKFPLFYDNYFVPRGYAVALPEMVGTNNSDGCPTTGGYEEIESIRVVIDWMNGRAKAWDQDNNEVKAEWTTGNVGMIGKSYDGTLANGVAATGVEGLKTIVPIGAISSWYNYYRYEGLTYYNNGPGGLASRVASSSRKEACKLVFDRLNSEADDPSGDYNEFWDERNYVKDVKNVKASVFAVHGLNDYNVKMNHLADWWTALAKEDVPRKLWLTQTGHVDPFDFRRAEWVDTLHRWFDYWLMDMENGIMDEPAVDIERGADHWETRASWPDQNAADVKIRLAPGENDQTNGTLTTGPVKGNFKQSFTDNPKQTEQQMVTNETAVKSDRLAFLSPRLKEDVRLSGIPEISLRAKVDKEDSNLTVLIVDYGTDTRINHEGPGEGIRTLDAETCWGESSSTDDACYKETEKTTHTAPYEVVTRGWFDPQNWKTIEKDEPLKEGKNYKFEWDVLPEDYVFKEGHRIGIIIAGSDRRRAIPSATGATFEVKLGQSYISLPVVGGKKAVGF
ncbi:Xaa-Pro dipeptidyl-peptidase [Cytobacillus firmus]|uniref:Xaa-Pro dipeptidyl-peptidase n=1 Tax=Cytobacillus firmus TaxID=1399 RepID=UPI0018CECEB4|nr:Xaa-Pro dipeptidyl-peptidase [Cytobacillus firmus]MBG9546792.1 x-prolyl-dipeptidyl aminopeptidase [Cytobacillus firmus]MBG9603389.1 x-prolyl-dipeptidyl aminopeptidase [Cytobacillus firmus]MED1942948.1 Xaa-Pro dipeptidyl-peptidase [Cytobacillus firmus]